MRLFFRRSKDLNRRERLIPCEVDWDKAFFHQWTPSGYALIEYIDGSVERVQPERVHFTD